MSKIRLLLFFYVIIKLSNHNRFMRPDCKKITQAINYLVSRQGSADVDELRVVKLMWAADRYHLRKYARTVTGDNYVAMYKGPVGSSTKDIIEFETGYGNIDDSDIPYIEQYNSYHQNNKDGMIAVVGDTDINELSKTDIEALDFALSTFGDMSTAEIIEFTHQYPEWQKCQLQLATNRVVSIDLLDFFEDPKNVTKDPFATSPEVLSTSKELFLEYV